jgi:hypothetical protein
VYSLHLIHYRLLDYFLSFFLSSFNMSPISRSLITFLALSSSIPLSSGRLLRDRHTLIPKQATPGFQCEYPTGWTSCNTPENRSCWVKDPSGNIFDINTDYETQIPQGKERTYELELTEEGISPDGTPKLAKLINGKYPGELIEACWGDTLIVNVKNHSPLMVPRSIGMVFE